jgi:hypothetical protein
MLVPFQLLALPLHLFLLSGVEKDGTPASKHLWKQVALS